MMTNRPLPNVQEEQIAVDLALALAARYGDEALTVLGRLARAVGSMPPVCQRAGYLYLQWSHLRATRRGRG